MKQVEGGKVIEDVAEKAKKLKETKTDTSGGDIALSNDSLRVVRVNSMPIRDMMSNQLGLCHLNIKIFGVLGRVSYILILGMLLVKEWRSHPRLQWVWNKLFLLVQKSQVFRVGRIQSNSLSVLSSV